MRTTLILFLMLLSSHAIADDLVVLRDGLTDRVVGLRSTTPPQTLSFGSKQISLVATYDLESRAMAHLQEHKELFGLTDPATQLELVSAKRNEAMFGHVRYRQVHQGVPVLGEAIVHFYPDGNLQMIRSSLANDLLVSVVPLVSEIEAGRLAVEVVAETDDQGLSFEAGEPELMILPLGRIERRSEEDPRLVWKLRVFDRGTEGKIQDRVIYLDATSGAVADQFSNIEHAIQQYVNDCSVPEEEYDCARDWDVWWDPPGVWYTHGRGFGRPLRGPFPEAGTIFDGSSDVDNCFDQLEAIHNMISFPPFNLNGANNQGGTSNEWPYATMAFTHRDGWDPESCPNSFFFPNSGNMSFCLGMVVPDVVAHEYGHAIHNYQGPSGSQYSGETGALEEAWCDIFGENGESGITGVSDWEFAALSSRGTIRNLSIPHDLSAPFFVTGLPLPDRYFDPLFYCGSSDNYGVHGNSTVVSHAFYLFAEGGEHNGCEIQSQGIEAAVQTFYEGFTNYFTATESFNDAYIDLVAACASAGYDSTTCAELQKALQAVEIDQPGGYCSGNPEQAPPCAVAHGGLAATYRAGAQPTTAFGVGEDIWLQLLAASPERDLDVHLLPNDPARPNWVELSLSSIDKTFVTTQSDSTLMQAIFTTTDEGTFDLIVDGNRDGFWQPWADAVVTITVDATVGVNPDAVPLSSKLLQAVHPNPFNPRTEVLFFARRGDPVSVTVYDVRGQQVAVLFEGEATGERQSVTWDATDQPSGVYMVQVRSGERVEVEKVALLK